MIYTFLALVRAMTVILVMILRRIWSAKSLHTVQQIGFRS